jgi:PAS domain S-box-containing protein
VTRADLFTIMSIQLPDGSILSFSLPQRLDSIVIVATYVLSAVIVFVISLPSFRGLRRSQRALLACLAVASVALNAVLLMPASALASSTLAPLLSTLAAVPLLGWFCMLLAGAWLGAGPAMLVGFTGGLGRWLLAGGRFTQPAEMALIAAAAAFLMQQNYDGRLAGAVRKPLVAGLIAGLLGAFMSVLAVFASMPGDAPTAADYTLSTLGYATFLVLGESLINSLLVQLACLAFPSMRRMDGAIGTPFYTRSLSRRLWASILPITFVTITVQVVVVGFTAVSVTYRQAEEKLSRNVQEVADNLGSFFVQGHTELQEIAKDERLQSDSVKSQQAYLESKRRAAAFFDELLLVDADRQIRAWARPPNVEDAAPPELTSQEGERLLRTLENGAPQRTGVYDDGQGRFILSFIEPSGPSGQPGGALVGRTRLSTNPRIVAIRNTLSNTLDLSLGYVIDDNDLIVVHPDLATEGYSWLFDRSQSPIGYSGRVYVDTYREGARRLIAVQKVPNAPWLVAFELPYAEILRDAGQIFLPLIAMFAVIMVGAFVLIPLISRRITQPLVHLTQAAGRIAQGELNRPVAEAGEDEVGQLGVAFEGMRQSLKDRLDDLSLLLRVSQSVADSLDLERGIPPILEAAVQVTSSQGQLPAARTARLLVFDEDGKPVRALTCGDGPANVTPLDEALATVTMRDEQPLIIENIARSRGALDPNLAGPGVRAIVTLPLWRSNRALGVIWLGYPEARRFSDSEVDLLVTLAGQAAVFLENVGLYDTAEGGRKRLQAVLSSTIDAVLVTDSQNRILLCNPAAEAAFGLSSGDAAGRPADEVITDPIVVDLLTERGDPVVRTAEVLMPDGRTLYASASSILSGDNVRIGRVAVLRDITHLKELDAMKTEFVATVSHDLRSPLTYMRGYVTMIPMIGQVETKQQDYLDKITHGIEQMTALIDDLLDLGRIEAGIGLVREPTRLADIAREAVESLQPQALARGLNLRLVESAPGALRGDRQLLKHAISNLIDNAVKYTPTGGSVEVAVDEHDSLAIVRVTDDGIGIAAVDQPRLFEKFYRVKRRDTIDVRGTGLGLAIVKSIAEWHHGRVWVESHLGKGSTFYIALPTEG